MRLQDQEAVAKALVADGKGILAADETVGTLTKRFETLKIASTPESRRDYRDLLFTTLGAANFINGVIMYDETIRQQASDGMPLPDVLVQQGVIPGIKVDTGAKPLAGFEGETVTEGLDGLRDRLKEYCALGARFAKWRAVIRITDQLPSQTCVDTNAHALGRYAALCQEQGIVPIVEPEVLMDGAHTIERCHEVTGRVLQAVFNALNEHKVSLESMLLKPNMVISGSVCPVQASQTDVAAATLRCLLHRVPAAVPGVVFLSGGQSDIAATVHLNAINCIEGHRPWKITFSYGRALQDLALATWLGKKDKWQAAQQAYYHRARCNAAATLGRYTAAMENEFAGGTVGGQRFECEDD
ncbi:MAG: class I fructose-bisphosphate aldolase [Candidatus Binataceae bacterium]